MRAPSPLFVEYGDVEVEEEAVVEDEDDDEMTGMEMSRSRRMAPEPWSLDEEEMRDCEVGGGVEMLEEEEQEEGEVVGGGLSRVPVPVPVPGRVPIADGGEMGMSEIGRGDGVVVRGRGRVAKEDAGSKVRVARRLRELYRRSVLVKDRKGRMRRVGGGLVGRREGL